MSAPTHGLVALTLLCWGCSRNPQQVSGARASAQLDPSGVAATKPSQPPLPAKPGVYYSFVVADDLSSIRAEVCFVGPKPERLIPPTVEAAPLLREVASDAGPLTHEDGRFDVAQLQEGACVRYTVDTTGALDAKNWRDGAGKVGRDALLSPDWWLWAPDEARFATYARIDVRGSRHEVLPWPREPNGIYTHRIPPSTFLWKAQGGFANRTAKPLSIGKAQLDVTVLGDGFGDHEDAVWGWLKQSADAVVGVLGAFPRERGQVLLVSDKDRTGSFGFVLQGGGPSATMLIPATTTPGDLAEDWTAVHELFHFCHPPMEMSESWFYEGLATYLTAVARARSGMTTKRYGWWELLDGFERGSKIGTGQSLRDECKKMHENRTYWRVYWSGAFMLLKMDVELRRLGKHTLADLIAQLAASRPDTTKRWTAEELVKKLDTFCDCTVPSKVTAEYLDAKKFPDVRSLTAALGVTLAGGKSVTYDQRAPDARIRAAIMGGD